MSADPKIADVVPSAPELTPYAEQHVVTYIRLLDVQADNADWRKVLLELAARERLTWRQLIWIISDSRVHLMVVGTPDDIAEAMISAFDQYAADGFNVIPAIVPSGLKEFVELVVSELRRRGKFRPASSGQTLRENLGLKRPLNGFTQAA
ncbi:hypothetical protein ACE103_09130 [Bradyrhizobium sp. ma5]|uniref:hypothetical protein n=1 Tax=Bradyrhizobium sp. ma5 TaxID=3344828 RepID=UPI0035D4D04E